MKHKPIFILLTASLIANGIFLYNYFSASTNELPLFDPFEINYNVTESSLLKNGYEVIPEDVPLLGKQHGDTLIYYQLDYQCSEYEGLEKIGCENTKVSWRNCIIPINKIDSTEINSLVAKYDADVISSFEVLYGNIDSVEFRMQFFAKHRFTKGLFRCFISKSYEKDNPYEMEISTDFPWSELEIKERK